MNRWFLLAICMLIVFVTTGGAQDPPRETATPTRPQFVVLTPVFFGFDSIEINDSTRVQLVRTAEILAANEAAVITVVGHTDERGEESYNNRLGRRRAGAVAAFLAAQGVAPSRINTTSAGEREPAHNGHDEVAWAKNRRVEFRVKGNTPLRLPQR